MIDQVIIPPLDPLVLDSIFETPGRNDPCHCDSGRKYKRCHESIDRAAWSVVMAKSRQADTALALVRTLPGTRAQYNPEPA